MKVIDRIRTKWAVSCLTDREQSAPCEQSKCSTNNVRKICRSWFGPQYMIWQKIQKYKALIIKSNFCKKKPKCFIVISFKNTLRTFVLWWRLSKRGHQTFLSAVRFVIYFSLFRIFRIISPKKGFYFLSPCQIEFAPKICQLKMNEFDSFKKSISMWKYIKIQVMDIR